ncbi:MAG: hypothetical protein VYA30_09115 [Myxococcota bacterium]|nr:hypothetical protein [Myxococcota bacterium]
MDAGVQFKLEQTDDGAGVICIMPIGRIKGLLERYPRAYERFFCPAELAYCQRQIRLPWQHYAVRLAAKFAYRSMVGRVPFHRIQVKRSPAGAPSIGVCDSNAPGESLWLSLSHEGEVAVALLRRGSTYVE